MSITVKWYSLIFLLKKKVETNTLFFINIKPVSILRLKFILNISIFQAYAQAIKYPLNPHVEIAYTNTSNKKTLKVYQHEYELVTGIHKSIARSLVVSDLRSETKGCRLEFGC